MRAWCKRRGRRLWAGLGVVVVLALAVTAAAVLMSAEPEDVSNPEVPFVATQVPTVAEPAPKEEGHSAFAWAVYGYTKGRTRYLPLDRPLRPPFAERWSLTGRVLLEFPPAMGGRSLYLLKNNGALYGIARRTGHVRWKRKLGHLAASSPAYAHGTVYVVLLERTKGVSAGRVVAVSAKDGHTRWSRKLRSRSESSPMIDRGNLYFGTEDGTVLSLRAEDGSVQWSYKAQGAVKGGLALDNGNLFFGDYAGRVTSLRATNGRKRWSVGTNGTSFGLKSGNFYATASVAFGRVYIGNTDGFVYSYDAQDGALAWRKQTGGFVYSSAAVTKLPGQPPTVYVGSYDGTMYALDARSGRVRWQRKAQGKISGGIVVLGDLVFYSTLARTTTALGAASGRKVWSTGRGAFNPVVSNGRGLFLVGSTSLFGLDARPPTAKQRREARRRARARARAGGG